MPVQISGVQLGVLTGGPSSIALSDLRDVNIELPQNTQYLRYNSTTSEWENSYIANDVFEYLNSNMFGSDGVSVTYTPDSSSIDIGISLSATGDVTGITSNGIIPLTLSTVNSSPGTFGTETTIPVVTVNAKGLVTSVTTIPITNTSPLATNLVGGTTGSLPYQSSSNTTTFLPIGTAGRVLISGTTPSWSNTLSGLTSVSATSFSGELTGNSTTATTLQSARTIAATGDAAWSVNFNGSANVSSALVLASVNANIGTFSSVTVNGKGLVTAATNLSGDATTLGGTLTFATVNSNVGSFASVTVNGKGLVTAASALSGDATTSGSTLTFATVNASPQSDQLRKITVNGKGLVTATTAVSSANIITTLGFTPLNEAGDTMTGPLILNANPTAALGAATKQYVDNIAAGLNVKASCIAATTATLATSSAGTITYANGTAGVGATLTTTGNFNSIGGATVVDGNRVLVKNEATAANNGIYIRTSSTVLTRTTDFDDSPDGEIDAGSFTFISSGTVAGTNWVLTTSQPITIGTTALNFTQLSGPGSVTGGTGVNVIGNQVTNTGVLSNIAGTGISVSGATGNVTIGNTGVTSLVAGTNINVSAATGAITVSVTGTVASATSAATATNVAGGVAGSVHYQSAASTTAMLAPGTTSQVLVSGTTPSWTNTPTLTGTNFSGTAASLNIGGNSGTATTLQTARTINGVSFNGSANITVTSNLNNGITFNNGGAGAASGTVMNGSTALTISYNTIGAPSTTGANASGTWGINITGNSATVGGFTPSQAAGTGSRVVVADASGYISNTYFNSSDNSTASGVSAVMVKAGDNYYRSGTAQAVASFLSGTSMNISGSASSATTATNLSGGSVSATSGTFSSTFITRNPGYVTAITSANYGSHEIPDVLVPASGTSFTPFLHGSTTLNATGYRGHVTFGAIRNASGGGWQGGAFVGLGGNDSYPTEYWQLGFGGTLSHSSGTVTVNGNITGNAAYASTVAVNDNASASTYPIVWNSGTTLYRTASSLYVNPSIGYQYATSFNAPGWFRSSSATGWYNETYGGGIYMADTSWVRTYAGKGIFADYYGGLVAGSSYGAMKLTGSTGGYSGIYESDANGTVVGMHDSSGNGGTYDSTTSWHFYWNRSHACLAIGGSATTSGYKCQVNGNLYVTSGVAVDGGITYGGNVYSANIGGGNIGVYNAARYQGVFAMGDAYKLPLDGTTLGTLYGIAWTHTNVGGQSKPGLSHQALFVTNAITQTAIGTGIWTISDVTAFSDARVKDNIEVISNALDKVGKIRGLTFTRLDHEDKTTRHAGVIAQEVEKVLPEVVTTDNEGMKSVAYGNMVSILIEAIKELNAKVEILKNEIRTLRM